MSKKKVAFITVHDSPNYGSCLQTYATQRVFEEMGCGVSVIDYRRRQSFPLNSAKRILREGRFMQRSPLFRIPGMKALAFFPVLGLVARRSKPLEAFRRNKLNLTNVLYTSEDQLERNCPEADIFCTGSDQVWNSVWNSGFEEPYYLKFAPSGTKKIAFASSLGKSSFEPWEKDLAFAALSEYDAISVREDASAKALAEIGVKDVVRLIDPTLLLTREDWEVFSADARKPSKPYVLIYQLNKNDNMVEYIRNTINQTGASAYQITYGPHERTGKANAICCPSVEEFVALFRGAEFVITDSFHGAVFSTLFEKRFAVMLPEYFAERLTDFLSLVGLRKRIVAAPNDTSTLFEPIDFDLVGKKLARERENSVSFLSRAIN